MRNLVTFILIAVVPAGVSAQPSNFEQNNEVKTTVDALMGAFEAEDITKFEEIMARDPSMVTFGTDASERWVGFEAVRDSFAKQVSAFEVEKINTSNQVIKIGGEGSVAWFSQVVDWSISINGSSQSVPGIRVTGVLEKSSDGWKIVQFHTSAPVQGQVVAY